MIKLKKLSFKLKKISGRNKDGKIIIRHRGGRVKKNYIQIDFSRTYLKNRLYPVKYKIIKSLKDPNRNCYINLIWSNNKFSYILGNNLNNKPNLLINSLNKNILNIGSDLKLWNMPLGSELYNLEPKPFSKSKYLRSAGVFGTLVKKTKKHCIVKLKSGTLKIFDSECIATLGRCSNEDYHLFNWKKAGISRLKGFRPSVRGVAMNPIDHPHGGGEGKTSGGRPSSSIWGWYTKGIPTTKKKIIKI